MIIRRSRIRGLRCEWADRRGRAGRGRSVLVGSSWALYRVLNVRDLTGKLVKYFTMTVSLVNHDIGSKFHLFNDRE